MVLDPAGKAQRQVTKAERSSRAQADLAGKTWKRLMLVNPSAFI